DTHSADGTKVLALFRLLCTSPDSDPVCFLTQAAALALRAERVTAISAEEHAHMQLVLLAIEISKEAFDPHPSAPPTFSFRAAIPQELFFRFRQPAVRSVESNPFFSRHFLELIVEVSVARLGPGADGAFIQSERRVGNHEIRIEINRVAEAV